MSLSYYTSGLETVARNRARMQSTGRTPNGHLLWSSQEDAILRTNYPDYRALQRKLPQRSYRGIRGRAGRLGICIPRRRWSAAEVSRLRRVYPVATLAELEAAFPDLTRTQIARMARYYHIRRRRRRLKITGYPIIDAIRERAFKLNYTMVDVDALTGKGRYFQRLGWSSGTIDRVAIWKAIEAMGGTLTVAWGDA